MRNAWVIEAIEKATALFSKWRMGRVKIWDYTPTHVKLILRVESRDIPGNLHIVCGECNYIRGPFSWNNCDLKIEQQTGEEGGMVLLDRKADFELHCGVIACAENVEPVYSVNLGVSPVSPEKSICTSD